MLALEQVSEEIDRHTLTLRPHHVDRSEQPSLLRTTHRAHDGFPWPHRGQELPARRYRVAVPHHDRWHAAGGGEAQGWGEIRDNEVGLDRVEQCTGTTSQGFETRDLCKTE